MKRTVLMLLVTMATPYWPTLASAQNSTPPVTTENIEAELVMSRYFAALVDGDITSLKALLGGDLLKKRSRLMDNPTYASYLSTTYMNAGFAILNYTVGSPNSVIVDATITFNQNETVGKQYVLEKSGSAADAIPYHIVSERSTAE